MGLFNRNVTGAGIIELKKLDQDFSVCKVKDYSLVDLGAEYCFIGKTDEEDPGMRHQRCPVERC